MEAFEGIAFALLTIIGVHFIRDYYRNSKERQHLKSLREKRQQERKAQFAEIKRSFPTNSKYESIVNLSFADLQKKLQNRELSAEDVLRAYMSKSMQVQEELNCITEYVPNALEKAKALDSLETRKGPLFGIPFCVKDDTNVKGMDSTNGLSKLLYKPAEESAVIVQILENLGAIAFCRTNLPQTCLSVGSDNPIYGRTLNPINKKLGPGGSSSGSASLVGSGGAPFGTGSDSGGSLRIPAHACGISTLRATSNRLSDKGMLHCSPNLTTVPGILVKNASDLGFIYEAMFKYQLKNPLDKTVPPIPWNDLEFVSKRSLKIGYFTSLKEDPAVGETENVVENAKKHLESLGHKVVAFEIPDFKRMWFGMMLNDSMPKYFLKSTKNDEIGECVTKLHAIFRYFNVFYFMTWITIKICVTLGINSPFGVTEIPPFPELEKEDVTNEILKRMENLDLLLTPAFPFCAVGADQMSRICMEREFAMMYPYIWNLVNFPAGVVKFGVETTKNWPVSDKVLKNVVKEDIIGMPIGVQIVGKPYQEEQVLRVLKELETSK